MKRREFVRTAAIAGLGAVTGPSELLGRGLEDVAGTGRALEGGWGSPVGLGERADLVLRGGVLFDGTGAARRSASCAHPSSAPVSWP